MSAYGRGGPLTAPAHLARFLATHPAVRGARAACWWRALRWQVGYRTGARRALAAWENAKLWVYPGSTGASGVLYVGLPEWDEMNFVLRYLRAGDHFADVGANVGSYSVLATARVPGVRVTAVEPGEPALTRLRENLALNAAAVVRVVASAVGDHAGQITFTRGRDTVNRIAAPGDPDTVTVPLTTLDALFADDPPALVKIDVEGAESLVFAGGARLLGGARAPVLLFEWLEDAERGVGGPGAELECQLAALHYRLATYDADTNALTPWTCGQPTAAHNRIAARDLDAVARRLAAGRAAGATPPLAVRVTLDRSPAGAPE